MICEAKGLACRRRPTKTVFVPHVRQVTLTPHLCVKGMAGAAVLWALRTLRPRTPAATSGRFPVHVEPVLPLASCLGCTPWRTPPVRALQLRSALCAGHNKWSKVKHIKGPKDDARGRMFMKLGMMIKIAVKGEMRTGFKSCISITVGAFSCQLWLISIMFSNAEGGPNPDMNVNLAQILEQCRGKNMPKASIEAAIKNAVGWQHTATYKWVKHDLKSKVLDVKSLNTPMCRFLSLPFLSFPLAVQEKARPLSQHIFEARGPGGCLLLIEVLTDNNSRSLQEIKRLLIKNGSELTFYYWWLILSVRECFSLCVFPSVAS